jgi:hypothetical protein
MKSIFIVTKELCRYLFIVFFIVMIAGNADAHEACISANTNNTSHGVMSGDEIQDVFEAGCTGTYGDLEGTVEGSVGTRITIDGSDFGIKKGRVTVGGKACKVSEWTIDSITCAIKAALPPGPHDVVVQPKDPDGTGPVTYEGAFTMMAPEILSVDPGSGPTRKIRVSGIHFGTKKGKVFLVNPVSGRRMYCSVNREDTDDDGDYDDEIEFYGTRCKVKEWTMNPATGESTLTFVVFRLLRTGVYGVEVVNQIGRTIAVFAIN